ncbi:hypothetical protein TCE0_044f17555 [Talaromyces pinophilus]|jgi:GH18 family chitinase|uniref:chitinase n=1 Tax=Talaromyces pinophilus TaxID=128442 RepID=A0A478ECG0_TALPI|nr:hypothetical protein TCE0_044f17555 [Talaromyces pinophilus]
MSCTAIQVASGDSYASVATGCGIAAAEFTDYNPPSTLWSTEEHERRSSAPSPYANGTCYTYYVNMGDDCSDIAAAHGITIEDIDSFNNQTWGWLGCNDLDAGMNICLSTGTPPFPAPLNGTVCGPQVPGTTEPTNGTAWESLNPCPLNACCDIWGQCGITPDFCTNTTSTTGAPGTAAAGSNGCISNCGLKYTSNTTPDEFFSIGYFEAFNTARSCLTMYPESIDTSKYTHIYYGFGNITSDYTISISDGIMFEQFLLLQDVKRVVSFGGWDFSTNPDTYMIFREGVQEVNRATFVQNVVDFVTVTGIDGVDFDWEYPGEPDIPGIPAGSSDEGANYLAFLKDLKAALPDGKTVSIAAPASYWYLRAFPIQEIAQTIDWIIYMTYDLHGVWDGKESSSQSGCPAGNCLRSDINLTETLYALSMVVKAGVPSNQIMVGVTSYGRSFEMSTAGCTGPECTWTAGGSAGPCTQTVGYISNAEINQILSENPTASWSDQPDDDTDILVYNETQWVGYMSAETKIGRTVLYQVWNFGGTSEWAIDLESYVPAPFTPISEEITGLGGQWIPPTCDGNASNWRCIDCNNSTEIVDAATPALEWAGALTDEALDEACSWYSNITSSLQKNPHDPTSWSSNILYYMGYSDEWVCEISAAPSSCDQDMACEIYETGMPVALCLVATTMSHMRDFYTNWYMGLNDASTELSSQTANVSAYPPLNRRVFWASFNNAWKQFKTTFAPDQDPTLGDEIGQWIVDQLLSVVGGGIWSLVSKNIVTKYAGDKAADELSGYWDDIWGDISDDVDAAVNSTGFVPSLSDIQSYLSDLVGTQMTAVNQVFNQTFNGSTASQEKFKSYAANGTWSVVNITDLPDTLQTITQQLMVNLLVYAWNLTEVYQPVIITTDVQDDTSNPFVLLDGLPGLDGNKNELSDDDAKASRYSIPGSGKTFWLVAANKCQSWSGTNVQDGSPICDSPSRLFQVLPGLTQLNGSVTAWGNLTYTSLIESAYGGYVLNGNANGYDISSNPDGPYITSSDGSKSSVPWTAGIATPGVFEVPICNYTVAAWTTLAVSWDETDTYPACPNFPCCTCEELGVDCASWYESIG